MYRSVYSFCRLVSVIRCGTVRYEPVGGWGLMGWGAMIFVLAMDGCYVMETLESE